MISRHTRALALTGLLAGAHLALPCPLPAQDAVVRAVLFYSPTCPHCHKVIQEDLPVIFARFGGEPRFYQGVAGHVLANGQLEILLVDGSVADGYAAYQASTAAFGLPEERRGVPRLVCGDSVLVGSLEIPERFPGVISAGLASGGVAWPAIPGLDKVFPTGYGGGRSPSPAPDSAAAGQSDSAGRAARDSAMRAAATSAGRVSARWPGAIAQRAVGALKQQAVAESATADSGTAPAPTPLPGTLLESRASGPAVLRALRADPVGTGLALLLLGGMIVSLIWVVARPSGPAVPAPTLAVPLLVVLGSAVAIYLTYVETTGVTAVCGPIGDCNAVQQSPYARLLGVIPVAVVGLAGYIAILAAWAAARVVHGRGGTWAAIAAFLLAYVGTAASAVFTALEPFVIGAVCAWCLASAAVMTALLWLLAGPGAAALRVVRPPAA